MNLAKRTGQEIEYRKRKVINLEKIKKVVRKLSIETVWR